MVISISFGSSSFHFPIKLNYKCKLPNCFPLYGISNKRLSKNETFCSNHTFSSSCMTQQQLKHTFQKMLYILPPPLSSLHKSEILAAAVYYNWCKLQLSELTFLRTEILYNGFCAGWNFLYIRVAFSDSDRTANNTRKKKKKPMK